MCNQGPVGLPGPSGSDYCAKEMSEMVEAMNKVEEDNNKKAEKILADIRDAKYIAKKSNLIVSRYGVSAFYVYANPAKSREYCYSGSREDGSIYIDRETLEELSQLLSLQEAHAKKKRAECDIKSLGYKLNEDR